MKINKTLLVKSIRYLLVLSSAVLFYTGYIEMKFDQALIAIILIWFANVLFSFEELKSRIFFLFFNFSQFVFLMGRPVISMLRGEVWWTYPINSELFAVLGLYLSLVSLHVGAVIVTAAQKMMQIRRDGKSKDPGRVQVFEKSYLPYIRLVAGIGFVAAWLCNIAGGIEKIIFMRGKHYVEYYASFSSSLPYVITVAGAMMVYFLCVYLACRPVKKWSFCALAMFIAAAVPSLIIGIRNPIVLHCIFAFLYYFIRDVLEDKEKWLGRVEKIGAAAVTPVAILFFAAYSYLRNGSKMAAGGIGQLFYEFIYNQGSSFDVLAIGYGAIPYLPERPNRCYTFGGIIDYFKHGSIAQHFFGAEALPDGNCLINALESNNFAHNMSYIAKGKEAYLSGEGFGSSYILEAYTDFGYVGIILLSIILGAVLLYGMSWLRKNILTFTITLVSLTSIFFIPRAEALGWIQFLMYLQFWIPVICCIIGGIILKWVHGKMKG